MKYNFKEIEQKWQKNWQEKNTFHVDAFAQKPKYYCLEMFPYPSGSGLHVGHLKNYVPMDAFCRYKSMKGFNVLHPMGWDAFGQPAENEAIKRGRNPREMVPEYAATYKRTLIKVGCSYDWEREINSSLPSYYRWTQWIFLLLFRKGLAYRATAPINWCPSCKTGLANEEVKDGRCWRCDTIVEKKPMPQWFFRITAYADRLLQDLDRLDWSEGMKEMQRDWIGRSEGAEIVFPITGSDKTISVFTTRPDTLFGATFMVLAPEHPLVPLITTRGKKAGMEAYIRKVQTESEIERLNAEREKNGVFTGAYAANPVNGQKIPIWVADYVLMGYGTGAIMAVPGQDQRDWDFAEKYELPIIRTVQPPSDWTGKAYLGEGPAINSEFLNGLLIEDATSKILAWLKKEGKGRHTITYRIRDWLISRQRYWGAPIPIVHCDRCGPVPVPENQLPVLLPEVENYHPSGTGESPLATIPEFVNTTCPACSSPARRETDTMGGYACSSWYFLRFADPGNASAMAAREALDYWLPVDLYAGGIEHARSHLLYARFWSKVLYDEKLLGFEEPFLILRNQGSLLAYTPGRRPRSKDESSGEEVDEKIIDWIVIKPEERDTFPNDQIIWRWARMSKSKGNVVTPDEIIERYGADSLRVYEMFVVPFEDDIHWSEEGIHGSFRFVSRVWRWLNAAISRFRSDWPAACQNQTIPAARHIRRKLHQTIRKVGSDLDQFQFNTAIAALMELLNEILAYAPLTGEQLADDIDSAIVSEIAENLILMMAPFAPHMSEELWQKIGKSDTIYRAQWPIFDPEAAALEKMMVVIQINGKIRDKIMVNADDDENTIKKIALASEKVASHLEGKRIVKTIFIKKEKHKMLSMVAQ